MKFCLSNQIASRFLTCRFFKSAHVKERAASSVLRSTRGVAYVELAILLAILFPLVVTFAFVWLPNFARRSDKLMTALSSMSGCLMDPVNLYRFQGGELVLREDYEQIVQGVVAKCGQMAAEETFCGFLYDKTGTQVATVKLNDPDGSKCGAVSPADCVGIPEPRGGIVLAFVLEDGTTRCEFTPADDPGAEPPLGEEQSAIDPSPGPYCPTNYFQGLCQLINYTAPNYTLNIICCMDGRSFDSASDKCTGCPTGFHSCTVTVPSDQTYKRCIPSGHSRLGNGGCCNVPTNEPNRFCADTEVACNFGLTNFRCCPSGSDCASVNPATCMDPFSVGLVAGAKGLTNADCGCNESDIEGSIFGTCPMALQFPISGTSACPPQSEGTLLEPPAGQC